MPLSVWQNSKDRVWDNTKYEIKETLQKAGVTADVDSLAEEIFERMWPNIFKEVLDQVNVTLVEVPLVLAMREKKKSLRDNAGN